MDKLLEICDSYDKYPEHFQVFLDNCIKTYKESFGANDYLFAAVYFIILETGFSPVELSGNLYGQDSVNFDIRRLRSVTCYSNNQIKISKNSNKSSGYIYQIPLKLGKHSSSECELQGVPSGEVDTHLIINFLSKNPQIVKSLCLNTETFTKKNDSSSGHKYMLTNLKELSILIKNKISIHIKDQILISEEEGCSANLLCLPEGIQKKIIYFFISDPVSLQRLSATCSYFYNFISNDPKLWEEVCFKECGKGYNKWQLNKALQDNTVTSDTNVFRTAFFKLKNSKNSRMW